MLITTIFFWGAGMGGDQVYRPPRPHARARARALLEVLERQAAGPPPPARPSRG